MKGITLPGNTTILNFGTQKKIAEYFPLSSGEVLVSKYFTEIAERIYGLKIELGTKLDFDVFTSSSVKGARWTREHLQPVRVYNLTVAGIYDVTRLRTLLANSFPSQMRVISRFESMPTIGTTDSVMIHVDDIGEEALDRIHNFGLLGGLFDPVSLVRSSVDELLAQGANNVEDNLLAVAAQIRERYPLLNIKYVVVLKDLGILIEVFLRGQMLTLLAVPVILMSMFVTIFTSESSVARRQGEVSILRSRGASYNQITSSIMWESGFLTLAGLALGLVLTIVMAPLLGAS
ncbi:MAG: FtsX-like permease family protein, partial [Candidatus Thorarchaeota archaeon]